MFNLITKWFINKAVSEADQVGVAMFSVEHGENVHRWIMAKLKSLSGWFSAKYGKDIQTDEQVVKFFDSVMHDSGDPAFADLAKRVEVALNDCLKMRAYLTYDVVCERDQLAEMVTKIIATLDGTGEVKA